MAGGAPDTGSDLDLVTHTVITSSQQVPHRSSVDLRPELWPDYRTSRLFEGVREPQEPPLAEGCAEKRRREGLAWVRVRVRLELGVGVGVGFIG